MSDKRSDQDQTDSKEQPLINSTTEEENDTGGSQEYSSQKRSSSSFGSLGQAEETNKKLPPGMKRMVQVEFKNTLLEIQEELKEFIKFVEDVQKKTPSEWEIITVTPLQTNTSPTSSSVNSNDDTLRELPSVDSRPTNAPIRDAFQIVRNLLSKIATLIDKIAFTTAISDDSRFDECSPQFSIYYAEYVFQIACFVLQMIGEHLNKFGKILDEASKKGIMDELPIVDDNKVSSNPYLFLHRKDHSFCPVDTASSHNSNYAMTSKKVTESNQQKSNLETTPNLSENHLRKRISDGLELLKFLSERMVSSLKDSEFTDFDKKQKLKENFNDGSNDKHKEQDKSKNNNEERKHEENNLNISVPPKPDHQETLSQTSLKQSFNLHHEAKSFNFNKKGEDFDSSKLSVLLKEELKKHFSEYSNEFSENSDHLDTTAIMNLLIQSFREAAGEENVKDNTESREDDSQPHTEQEREKQLDDVLEVFVNETYKFAILSLTEMRRKEECQFYDTLKTIQKADTEPEPITMREKVIPLGRPKSSSELRDRTGIQEIKECPSCPRTVQFQMSDYVGEKSKDLFPLKDSDDDSKRFACGEDCLKGKVLHENHYMLPPGKMEVRQVNDRGRVLIVLEDYDETAGSQELINCTALVDLRKGKSRMEMKPSIRSKNRLPSPNNTAPSILKALMLNISSSRRVENEYLMETTSHSELTPIKTIGGAKHEKATPDVSEIVDKMWDLGKCLRNAGYASGPPLVLKLRYEKVYEEAFKTLVVPSGIPLSYYKRILFHIYEKSEESEVEDLTDEIFPILGENIFRSTDEGLFDYPTDHSMFVYPNPASNSLLEWFRFSGMLLAVAIIQNEYLGVKLPLCFYKCLLDRPLTLHDLKEIDPDLHQKLTWLNENNVSSRNSMFYFTIQEKVGKQSIVTELIDGGKQVSVTENNKMLFIEKCLKRKIVERCLVQFKELIAGFTSVLEPRFLDKFNAEEIQTIIEKCLCLSESESNKDDNCKKLYRRGTF